MPSKRSKKIPAWKKAAVTGAVAATLGLGFWSSKAFYTVAKVIDGDTFFTKEGVHVRLDNVDAPEMGLCMSTNAKSKLEKLVLNKKIFIKTRFIDKYGRMNATVYTSGGNVNDEMLASGLVKYQAVTNDTNSKRLLSILNKAKDAKLGIYSAVCTQTTNPTNPKCNIKGNVRHADKYFRYPGCSQYETTLIQLYEGDTWFCTEGEAKKAGFVKGSDCN